MLVIGATGGNIYDNREGARPKSKAIRQGKGQGADMIGVMNYSQDGIYDNPSRIDGKGTSSNTRPGFLIMILSFDQIGSGQACLFLTSPIMCKIRAMKFNRLTN